MKKIKLDKLDRGIIKIEIQLFFPEKFINLLWKNNIEVENIKKINITTIYMDVKLKDFYKIEGLAKKTDARIKVVSRKGFSFILLRLMKQSTLIGGSIIFILILYYLSTYIWGIDIVTDKYLSPYEIRHYLDASGIKPGTPKKNINVYKIEENLNMNNNDVMWSKVRIEGSKLKVNIVERFTPPQIISDSSPCNIVASMDGQIETIYTKAGTAAVKPGDMVKRGQVLVNGIQGKEGSTYAVHASGEIIAKTFYEDIREIPIQGSKVERTGKKVENKYFYLFGKKIYIKKSLNKFESYDRIEDSKNFIKSETFYETKKTDFVLDKDKVKKEAIDDMTEKNLALFDKSAKLVDKIEDSQQIDNKLKVRVVFVVEQEIGIPQAVQ